MRCNTKELQKNRNLNKIIIAGLVIVAIICRILGKVSSRYIYIIAGVLRILDYILDGGSALISESFKKPQKIHCFLYQD